MPSVQNKNAKGVRKPAPKKTGLVGKAFPEHMAKFAHFEELLGCIQDEVQKIKSAAFVWTKTLPFENKEYFFENNPLFKVTPQSKPTEGGSKTVIFESEEQFQNEINVLRSMISSGFKIRPTIFVTEHTKLGYRCRFKAQNGQANGIKTLSLTSVSGRGIEELNKTDDGMSLLAAATEGLLGLKNCEIVNIHQKGKSRCIIV